MNCTPSARIEEKIGGDSSSVFAEEGTLAHEFGDVELTRYLKKIRPKTYENRLEELRAHKLYSGEMEDYVALYTGYVIQEFKAAKRKTKDAVLLIEEKVDLTDFIENGFGTNDAMIIADGVLEVIDLKYGKGVRVDATNNSQLMLYGLGALNYFELSYDIHTVRLTISQPRLDSISSWDIKADELMAWGENEVRTKAAEAYEGKGLQSAGSWCKWCKAKPQCATRASQNMKICRHEFKDPHLLTTDNLADIYQQSKQISDWLKAVGEHMLKEALAGVKFKGLKVVEGRSTRKWTSEEDVKNRLAENGFMPEAYITEKLKGITEIEKEVGKKEFPILLDGLVVKPQGSPTLADENDKRRTFSSAADDFKE
jgi:hypothetical protein